MYGIAGPRALPGERVPPAGLRRPRAPPGAARASPASRRSACPPTVADLASEQHGLVLVTGLAGSGKTATMAAMVDHVNQHREGHIVTIEDPVEVLHADKRSIVDQREVGTDTPTRGVGPRARAAPGSRRHRARASSATTRRRLGGAPGGRDRAPRDRGDVDGDRDRHHRPVRRAVPAAPPAPGARDARGDAARHRVATPAAARRRSRTRARGRGPRGERAGARTHRRPGAARRARATR